MARSEDQQSRHTDLQCGSPDTKARLSRVAAADLDMPDGTVSPLDIAVQKLAHSLAVGFETGRAALVLPVRPAAAVQKTRSKNNNYGATHPMHSGMNVMAISNDTHAHIKPMDKGDDAGVAIFP